jgi:rhodanese-related sulfurtransferase
MDNIFPFITNHWMLASAFVTFLILFVLNEWHQKISSGTSIETFEAVNKMNRQDAVVIDIRSQEKYKTGHIINAVHNPSTTIDNIKKHIKREVIVVCDTGMQANSFSAKLKKEGFEHVAVLKGGMQAWQEAQLPLAK